MGSALNRMSVGQSWTLLGRPSGGRAEFIGARQVSWLAAYRQRRLPGPAKVQWRDKRRHAAHSRGGGHRSAERPTVFPFHPRSRSRDRARVMSQLREGLSNGGQSAFASPRARQTAQPVVKVYVGEEPSIENRPARTSGGSSSNGLGGEPRGPNQVLSSHNAVILTSATIGRRVGTSFSASAKNSPRQTTFRRIDAPFHAAARREHLGRSPMTRRAGRKCNVWR